MLSAQKGDIKLVETQKRLWRKCFSALRYDEIGARTGIRFLFISLNDTESKSNKEKGWFATCSHGSRRIHTTVPNIMKSEHRK